MNVNGHDKSKSGGVDVAIGIHEGKVVIHWHQPMTHISFDPQNAFEFGEQMARVAHKARFGTDAPSDGSYLAQQVRQRLTEDLRNRMVMRAMHVIRSLQESGRSPDFVAKELVDTIFAEVA
jgi:hypothetical protein